MMEHMEPQIDENNVMTAIWQAVMDVVIRVLLKAKHFLVPVSPSLLQHFQKMEAISQQHVLQTLPVEHNTR